MDQPSIGIRVNHPTILSPLVCVYSGSVLFIPRGLCLSLVWGVLQHFQRECSCEFLPASNLPSTPATLAVALPSTPCVRSFLIRTPHTCVLVIHESNKPVEHHLKHRNNNGVCIFVQTIQPTKRKALPLWLRT
jgi:hypothetical protein